MEIVEDTPEGVWLEGLPAQVRVITVGQDFVAAGQEVEPVTPAGDGSDIPVPWSEDGPDSGMPAAAFPGPADPATEDPGTASSVTATVPRSAS